MSQPSPSLIRAALVVLRSERLRQSVAGALKTRLAKAPSDGAARLLSWGRTALTCALVASVIAALLAGFVALCAALAFAAPKAGRLAELWLGSADRVFYALPATPSPAVELALESLTLHDGESARALSRRLAQARADTSLSFGMSPSERSGLLAAIELRARKEATRHQEAAAEAQKNAERDHQAALRSALLEDALRLAQALRDGKSPEQAAAELRSRPAPAPADHPQPAPPARSAFEAELLEARSIIAAAAPIDASALSLAQRFSFSWAHYPRSANALAYADDAQAQARRPLFIFFIGMGACFLPFLFIFGALKALGWARALAEEASAEIELEGERQSLRRATRAGASGGGSRRL